MIKKIKYLILMIIFIPALVKADMGAPMLGELEAVVSNPAGATCKDGKKIDYGKTVILLYNSVDDGTEYYSISVKNEKVGCEVKAKDISPIEYDLNKLKHDYELVKYAYKETKMYNGPLDAYGEIEEVTIPAGTILKSQYYTDLYMYVTYNGTSGWVYYYPYLWKNNTGSTLADIGATSRQGSYTAKDMMLYDNPFNGKELNTIVPADTKINLKYIYTSSPGEYGLYVTYNGIDGWIVNTEDINGIKYEIDISIYVTSDELNIYNSFDKGAKAIGKLSKNQEYNAKYIIQRGHGNGYLYIKTDNLSGWVMDSSKYAISDDFEYPLNGDYTVYKSFSTNSELLGNIRLNGKIKIKYHYYKYNNDTHEMSDNFYYIENINGMTGWINVGADGKKHIGSLTIENITNVYKEADIGSGLVGYLEKGEQINYYDTKKDINGNDWYYIVNYKGLTGWFTNKAYMLPNMTNTSKVDKIEINNLFYILGGTIIFVIIAIVVLLIVNKKKKKNKIEKMVIIENKTFEDKEDSVIKDNVKFDDNNKDEE